MLQYETSEPFRNFVDAAVRVASTKGFPARVITTAAACESAWFTKLTGDFNYYGIIAANPPMNAKFCPTHEDITQAQLASFRPDEQSTAIRFADLGNGKFRCSMSRWFACYSSLEESVAAYIDFFVASPHRYKAAWEQYCSSPKALADEERLLTGICEAGYATGGAESIEDAIFWQSNVDHAIQMAAAKLKPHVTEASVAP